jgi:hypothetical protein
MTAQTVTRAALDTATARAATDRLKLTLVDAHDQLIGLWRDRAHVALGYGDGLPGWQAYLAAEFGELLHVLPTADQLGAMVDAGMTQREVAAPFGVSLGKVNGLLRSRRDGAGGSTGHPSPVAPDDRPTWAQVADIVAAAGPKGLTIPQVVRRTGWTYGAASGALSRAERRGRVTRPADLDQRGGFRPYRGTP